MKTVLLSTLLLVTVSLPEGFRLEKKVSPVGEAERGLAEGQREVEEEPVPHRRVRGLWEQSWGREVGEKKMYGVLTPL